MGQVLTGASVSLDGYIAGPNENRWIDISVVDQGVGLVDADRDRLSEPFYRSPRTLKIAGLGMG